MKTILLILTITIGVLFPFTHSYSFLIKYLLMTMLFFSFLKMEIKREHFEKSHFTILVLNIFLPIIIFFMIRPFSLELSQIIFITAIAPTAIASPIIVNLLKGKIEFTVISILTTNFSVAFLLPFLLPAILNHTSDIAMLDVLIPVATVFLIPYLLAQIIKKLTPQFGVALSNFNKYIFYVLILNINLGTAKASNYIRMEMSFGDLIIYQIAIASLILCIMFFYLGKIIAPNNLRQEGSQSLGQKNNGFTVWVAITFMSPLAVLGPVFYILFQNIYISWQLQKENSK